MASEKSYYEVLGVTRQASADEIRQTFKRVVVHKHPDRGGSEEEFVAIQKAYEVLSDGRRRRIYDRFGEKGLELSGEALFMQDFRGGTFAAGPEKELEKEVSDLRKENESLQRALMLVRPETASSYASSFDAWLRNRDPNEARSLTTKDLINMYGVAEGSYKPVTLPELKTFTAEYTGEGDLDRSVTKNVVPIADRLGWGEVLVHMLSAPVTMFDRHVARWGFIPGADPSPVKMPALAGAEGVGMVVRVGPGVENLKVHDLVLPRQPTLGTWRRIAVLQEAKLFRFPATTLTPDVIANFYAFCTAYCLLRDFGSLKPGDTIIQSSAETVVGQAVIGLCKLLQIKTINLVEPRDDFDVIADKLQAKGATHVWKNEGAFLERIRRSRLSLPRLGIDDQGGATLTRLAECLRPDSTLVLYGATTSKVDSFPYSSLLYRNLEVRGFSLFRQLSAHEEDFANLPHLLLPLLEQGTVEVDISPWDRLDESLNAALADKNPNVLLKFGTTDDALALAKTLEATGSN